MKRKWKYLLWAFLLTAGLLVGCGAGAGQPQQRAQEAQSQEMENQDTENPAEDGEFSENDEDAFEALETPESSEITESSEASESQDDPQETNISEDGVYTSKEEVAEYIFLYGHLPDNFITKKEAKALGWVSSEGNLREVAPGKSIGGDYFGNFEGNLPEKEGRDYHECDIDSSGGYRGAKRIVYSNDGLIYYTEDHYNTFELLYGEE